MQGRCVIVDRGVDAALAAELADDGARRIPAHGHALAHHLGQLVIERRESRGLEFDDIPHRRGRAEGFAGRGQDRLECFPSGLGGLCLLLQPLRSRWEGQRLGDEGEE